MKIVTILNLEIANASQHKDFFYACEGYIFKQGEKIPFYSVLGYSDFELTVTRTEFLFNCRGPHLAVNLSPFIGSREDSDELAKELLAQGWVLDDAEFFKM